MSDYNLNGLNNRDFEHLTQALSLEAISQGVTPYGDGPDGGREATFKGKMQYPSEIDAWDGYLVIQSKFRTRPSSEPGDDIKWILNQLEKDLLKFEDTSRNLEKPDYYILVTNVILTPVQEVGGKDKVFELFKKHQPIIGYRGYDVWDFDKVCRLLDRFSSVRNSYAGFISSGDVLSEMMNILKNQQSDFSRIISLFLQHEMLSDQFVKLEQAGHNPDHKTLLAQVFVDLPVSEHFIDDSLKDEDEIDQLSKGIVDEIIKAGSQRLKRSLSPGKVLNVHGVNIGQPLDEGRFVIVGGPGQGKSTISQFICQLYRAAILKDQPSYVLSSESASTLGSFIQQCEMDNLELPVVRRFPFRVVLDQFATELANGKVNSLLGYIWSRIARRIDTRCSIEDLRGWLENYPWLIVLDGLDEVPASSNRKQVLEMVTDFWAEVSSLDADVLVVSTTRPQGYNEEFSPKFYHHRYLVPLTQTRALDYAERLSEAQYGTDPDRKERVLMRLKMACEQETTRRLMRSPLQVTIMATLVDKIGQPPQERWRLFQQYYEVIYQRETERDIQTSRILQQRKADVNVIHHRVGLLLQKESEEAGRTESRLAADRFHNLVYSRIEEEGHEGQQLKERAKEITDAALHRLVFLVGLQDDRIGFEIRSLQEFMAAEALMDGKDEQVKIRLETIAPISHWRNVFLFAAGKCFADRQFLRDMIVTICEQLNDSVTDRLAGVTLSGSRLALDILIDGVAREQPKYSRSLVRIALKLIDIQDLHACRTLGSVYEPSFEEVYRRALTQKLDQKSFAHKLGAWAVLFVLIEQQVEWAIKLADSNWPEEISLQEEILRKNVTYHSNDWIIQRLIKIIPQISPLQFLHTPLEGNLKYLKEDDIPKWFKSLVKFFSQYSFGEVQRDFVSITFNKSIPKLKLEFKSIFSPNLNVEDIPFVNQQWTPYVSFSRFAESPSAKTLAEELRWLSSIWESTSTLNDFNPTFHFNMECAWPLAACLKSSNSPRELVEFAENAEKGYLGCLEDWRAAEERWKSKGVTEDDIFYSTKGKMAFDKSIANIGFPFMCSELIIRRVDFLDSLFISLWDIYKNLKAGSTKKAVAKFLLNLLGSFEMGEAKVNFSLNPTELKELINDAIAVDSFFRFPSAIKFPDNLDHGWMEFLNWLGNVKEIHIFSYAVKEPLVDQLCIAFNEKRDFFGILHILSNTEGVGKKNLITEEALLDDPSWENDVRRDAFLVRIMQGNWDETDIPSLAKLFMDVLKNHDYFIYQAVYSLNKSNLLASKKEAFLLFLLDEFYQTDAIDITRVIETLDDIMNARTSLLNDKNHWLKLGLPVIE